VVSISSDEQEIRRRHGASSEEASIDLAMHLAIHAAGGCEKGRRRMPSPHQPTANSLARTALVESTARKRLPKSLTSRKPFCDLLSLALKREVSNPPFRTFPLSLALPGRINERTGRGAPDDRDQAAQRLSYGLTAVGGRGPWVSRRVVLSFAKFRSPVWVVDNEDTGAQEMRGTQRYTCFRRPPPCAGQAFSSHCGH
jgi:hypothetical protein